MRFVLTGVDCPRLPGVSVGLQRGTDVVQAFPAQGSVLTWTLDAQVVRTDLRGPYVHGKPGARFLYLSWQRPGPGMLPRAKLMLDVVPSELLLAAHVPRDSYDPDSERARDPARQKPSGSPRISSDARRLTREPSPGPVS